MHILQGPFHIKTRHVLLLSTLSLMASTGIAQQPSLITRPIDDSSRTAIQGSVHPLARRAYDAGAVESGLMLQRMILVLGPGSEQEAKLPAFLDSQIDKTSPNYHRWLTPEEFGEKFGPSPNDLQQVTAWLQQQGFRVENSAQSRRWIEFSGTTLDVETAFHTQMRRYQVNGNLHAANATEISIPSALAPVVRGVASLHDFFSKPLVSHAFEVRRDSQGALIPVEPEFTLTGQNGPVHYLVPGDFASIYNLTPLYQSGLDGTGQTIAVVARANIELSDVETFRQIFGLPANDPNVILNGSLPDFLPSNDALEASLDAEWAGAVAPKATVTVVATASTVTSDGTELSAAYIVDKNLAGIMSVSFQACEQDLGPAGNSFVNALWQQAAAQGISVFVAAGDNGPAGCDDPNDSLNQPAVAGLAVNGLASTPFNTAVGGTQFSDIGKDSTYWNATNGPGLASAKGYIPEAVWNESCDPTVSSSPCFGNQYSLIAGSGGSSAIYGKPSWQTGPGVPTDVSRDLPDVSLAAASGHDGFLICFASSIGCQTDSQGNLTNAGVVGGTSASSPTFAGILAIVAQGAGGRQGLANYILYRLASNQQNPGNCDSSNQTDPTVRSQCVFNDITAGNNNVPGQVGFSAQAGFDLATGLGSVNATNLVNKWNSVSFEASSTTLASTQTQVQHGQPVQLTVNVSASSGTDVPSGSVALFTDEFGPAGIIPLTNGAFTGFVSSLPGGQYNLTAHYQGDGTFGGSDSNSIPINISTESSSVTLSAFTYNSSGPTPVNSLPYGYFVYFHAQVASASGNGAPTGTVTFQDGATVLGTFSVDSSGVSELVSGGFSVLGSTLCLTLGSHSITATYSGDNSFNSATSQPFIFTVAKANTIVTIPNATPLTLVPGQLLPLLAEVANSGPILPSGTVQFLDNGIALGNPVPIAPISSGLEPGATAQVSLPIGSHSITATYSGDDLYNSCSSIDSLPVTVAAGQGVTSQTTLTVQSGAAAIGQQIVFSVSVTSSQPTLVPTGTIQLNGPLGEPTGPVVLQNGSATITVFPVIAGPLTLFAQYSGDSNYAPSASAPLTVAVAQLTPSVTLIASASVVASGNPVSLLTKMVDPSVVFIVPSEMVQYFDSLDGAAAQPIGGPHYLTFGNPYSTLTNAISAVLPVGTNVITAQYLGDANLNAAISNPVTVTVTAGDSFQLSASSNSLTLIAGQSGSVVLTVNPVAGFNGATSLSCGTYVPAGATCSIMPNPVTPNGSAVTATLMLSTVAPSSSVAQLPAIRLRNWPALGGTFALAGLILISWPRRRRMFCAALGVAMIAAIFVFGCGGSGSQQIGPSGPAATTTTLTSSATKTAQGATVTLTATINSSLAEAAGNVTFFDSGAAIGQPVALSGGVAQIQLSSLPVGTHSITAAYAGDANHSASSSGTLHQVITGTIGLQISATSGGVTKSLPLSVVIE